MYKAKDDLKWILETFMRIRRASTKGAKNLAVKKTILLMHYQSSWEKLLSHQTLLKQDKKTQLFKLGRLGKQSKQSQAPISLV